MFVLVLMKLPSFSLMLKGAGETLELLPRSAPKLKMYFSVRNKCSSSYQALVLHGCHMGWEGSSPRIVFAVD